MLDRTRLYATMFIWGVFTIMLGAMSWRVFTHDAVIGGPEAVFMVVLMGTMALAATFSTRAIWQGLPVSQTESNTTRNKTKRVEFDRVERLIEALDDDDIYDLEALLLARDESKTTGYHGT